MKYIAFLSMFIDHTNKALIYPNLDGGALNRLSDFFDILGRIAFPIFIFLLVEGYFHTSTKWRYLVTLLVFGVISEVPFDMCTSARFVEINWNNIMFTLALVLAMIWVIDVLKEKMASLPKALWYRCTRKALVDAILIMLSRKSVYFMEYRKPKYLVTAKM